MKVFLTEVKRQTDIHFYFVISYSALKFSENIHFYFTVFQKNCNSNSIFHPSMEYLTTKILYSHPNWKHVAALHSKRRLVVLTLHFIEQWKIELELEYFWKTSKQNMKLRTRIGCPPSASIITTCIPII